MVTGSDGRPGWAVIAVDGGAQQAADAVDLAAQTKWLGQGGGVSYQLLQQAGWLRSSPYASALCTGLSAYTEPSAYLRTQWV